jgi:hypothetical protein
LNGHSASKVFFSEEKKQKTFIVSVHKLNFTDRTAKQATRLKAAPESKSFLVLFFKKEHSSYFLPML